MNKIAAQCANFCIQLDDLKRLKTCYFQLFCHILNLINKVIKRDMAQVDVKDIGSKLILVVDDQGTIRNVVKSYFHEMGFKKVSMAIDGNDALNFMSQHPVDIVICDWQMPKISGLEFLKKIRNCGAMKDLPFVMMTSTADVTNVQQAVAFGVSDYLIKPFKPTQLGYKVVQLLGASKHKAIRLPVSSMKAVDPELSTENAVDLEVEIENSVDQDNAVDQEVEKENEAKSSPDS